jgi:hypothetical protein
MDGRGPSSGGVVESGELSGRLGGIVGRLRAAEFGLAEGEATHRITNRKAKIKNKELPGVCIRYVSQEKNKKEGVLSFCV